MFLGGITLVILLDSHDDLVHQGARFQRRRHVIRCGIIGDRGSGEGGGDPGDGASGRGCE